MTTLDPRSGTSSPDPLEARLAEALGARAALKRVDAASLEERRALVHAAVDDDVVSLDVDSAGDDAAGHLDGFRRGSGPSGRGRRPVVLLLAAAAAAVLVVAGVGVVHRTGTSTPPAAGSSAASARWHDLMGLDREPLPEDAAGVDLMGGDVVADSVRSLADLGPYRYWAGWDDDGGLCWAVSSPDGQSGGCSSSPSTGEPVEVSDGEHSPALYLVLGTDPQAPDLEARGFTGLLPNVWVDADALGTAEDLFARLRAPQTTADTVPEGRTAPFSDDVTPTSVRELAQEGPKSLYLGTSASGEVCLAIVDGETAGSTCQAPVVVATEGMWVGLGGPEGSTTAWLAPDDLDTSGWPALGRRQLTLNLWYAQPEDDGPDPAAHRLELRDGTTAFTGTRGDGTRFDIRLTGRVVVLDGGCLGLDDGTRTGVLVLQPGTTVLEDGQGLVTPAGAIIRVGDSVAGGDGGSGIAGTGLQEAWRASSPECFAGHEVYAVDVTEVTPR